MSVLITIISGTGTSTSNTNPVPRVELLEFRLGCGFALFGDVGVVGGTDALVSHGLPLCADTRQKMERKEYSRLQTTSNAVLVLVTIGCGTVISSRLDLVDLVELGLDAVFGLVGDIGVGEGAVVCVSRGLHLR